MAVFSYKGFDQKGKLISGFKEADSQRALQGLLKKEGIFLTEAKESAFSPMAASGEKSEGGSWWRILTPAYLAKALRAREKGDRIQVAVLTRQMGTLLRAGVPLAETLAALVEQVEQPGLQRILADVKIQVNEGSSLGDALARHPRTFPELYVNMIRAGEASGSLEVVLFRLAEFLDTQNRLRAKVISALFYPAVMVVVGTGILGILMVSVVPKVTAIFADTGQALPWNTQLLILIANITGNYWWLLLILAVAATVAFRRWQSTPKGRVKVDRWLLKVPIFGAMARQIAVTRFAKTLSTLLSSGVPFLRALDIVKAVVGNSVLVRVIEEAKESIKEGESIAAPLRRSKEFPPLVTHMIAVGERSGQLEQMLENVAQAYETEVDLKMGRLTTLLEPVMILVMGGSVAFVVFSILLPIMQMNEFVN